MRKKSYYVILTIFLISIVLAACSGKSASSEQAAPMSKTEPSISEPVSASTSSAIPDGVYSVDFNTDSSMFHVNEAYNGKGILTVQNGEMTVHVTLVSKSILNLYSGRAEDAKKQGATLLNPTEDPVVYKDGYKETVYGFDIPVPSLDTDFPLAIIGKKGTWYDHTVSVSNPEPIK